MSLGPGSTIGPFKIQSLIGKGGMGEVFSAIDTRVDRKVAVKVLPNEFAQDPERLRRFQLEARTLATLNHPNVALLFGFEEHAAQNLLVLELVEGETLADRLRRGALPLEEAVQIAIQITAGLEAAHAKGIVHRDLKPANIKLTQEDHAKVLDFGLAKLVAPDSSSTATVLSDSPTILTGSTLPGVILGTAAYMSPEQAKGKPVDKRTDIWSFGCVLYECLTGKRVFDGESATECIGAVLHKEPDWSKLPSNTPIQLQLLLRRCLSKDRGKRLHDIADARLELDGALSESASDGLQAAPRVVEGRVRKATLALAGALLFGALLGVIGTVVLRSPSPGPTNAKLSRKSFVRLPGAGRDTDASFAISPDGSRLAFISNNRLYIRYLTEFDLGGREIPNSQGALLPFWSPDGEWVGYFASRKLYKVRSSGGQPQPIAEAYEAFEGAGGGAWLEDNTIVFGTGSLTNGLLRVSASGGLSEIFVPTEPLTEVDFHDPAPLPDAKGVLFVVHGASNGVAAADMKSIAFSSGKTKRIVYRHPAEGFIQGVTYSRTGHLLFGIRISPVSGGDIWVLPFSLAEMKATGEARLLYSGAAFPKIANDGTLIFLPRDNRPLLRLAKFDRSGRTLSNFGTLQYHSFGSPPAWSPDGKRVLGTVFTEEGRESELWMHEAMNSYQFTFAKKLALLPAWSPDGSAILFTLRPRPLLEGDLATIPSNGGEPKTLLPGVKGVFSSDGKTIVYSWAERSRVPPYEIRSAPFPPGTNVPVTLFKNDRTMAFFDLSPDDRFFAFESGDDSDTDVFITRFPSFTGKWQINSPRNSFLPVWRKIGGQLYLFFTDHDGAIFEVHVEVLGDGLVPGQPRKLFERNVAGLRSRSRNRPPGFTVSSDGQEFLAPALPENASQEVILNVVENFAAELRK